MPIVSDSVRVCTRVCTCMPEWVSACMLTQSGAFALGGCSQGTLAPMTCRSATIVAENPSVVPRLPTLGYYSKRSGYWSGS